MWLRPPQLVRQWHHELDTEFWLDFSVVDGDPEALARARTLAPDAAWPGAIVTTEAVARNADVGVGFGATDGGDLLVVDEAHHLNKSTQLCDRVQAISAGASRVLILSATPIQRRTEEYLTLLRLINPSRYLSVDETSFRRLIGIQERVRSVYVLLAPALTGGFFDAADFCATFEQLQDLVDLDPVLRRLVREVSSPSRNRRSALEVAEDAAVLEPQLPSRESGNPKQARSPDRASSCPAGRHCPQLRSWRRRSRDVRRLAGLCRPRGPGSPRRSTCT